VQTSASELLQSDVSVHAVSHLCLHTPAFCTQLHTSCSRDMQQHTVTAALTHPILCRPLTSYTSCCSHLQQQLPTDKPSKEQWWYPFAKIGCGAAAGIAAQTASYPLDTLRRRLQVNGAPGTSVQYKGYLHCLRHMAQHKEGLLWQLFKGWGINCLKTAPGAAVQFVAYDLLRLAVTSIDPKGAVSPL
jgi:hypothetical protein